MGDPVATALMVVAVVAWVVMIGTIIRQDRRNARRDRERMDKEERERMLKLADVGLRAVIDEATGYQEVRSPSDLRDYAAELGLDDVNAKKRKIELRVIPERDMLVNWHEIAEQNSANLAAAVIAGDIKGVKPSEADYALAKKHGLV